MSRLSLYLPGLQRAAPAAPLPPSLVTLLARADWRPASHSLTQALLSRLGYATALPLPIANLCACHDLGLHSLEDGWYRADPVHLRADPRLVLLLAPQPGEISPDEAAACLKALNAQLPEGVWRSGRAPERWYVQGPRLGEASSHGPAWLNGRSITPFVSRAPEAREWRTLFNDAQMVLHAVPGNEARELEGHAAVNAVWLWGGGPLPSPQRTRIATVGNDLLLAGASRGNAIDWLPAATFGTVLSLLETSDVAMMLGTPWGRAQPDLAALDLETFATSWLPQLWPVLGKGALEEVELIGETHHGRLRAGARWKVWRRHSEFSPGDPHAIAEAAVE